jgi:hypothetical protein
MFRGSIVWRGLIYTIFMAFGKLLCGLWLVRIPVSHFLSPKLKMVANRLRLPRTPHFWGVSAKKTNPTAPSTQHVADQEIGTTSAEPNVSVETRSHNATANEPMRASSDRESPHPRKPISLYPGAILGTAMVARGEIGFLISSIAESNGIFSSTTNEATGASEIFLIITWAIVLCTVLGPLCVGLLVRRVKNLQAGAEKSGRNVRADVLGVWGIG